MQFDVNKIIHQIDEIGKKEYSRCLSEGERQALTNYILERSRVNEAYWLAVSGLTEAYAKMYYEKAVFMYFNEPPIGQVKFYWKDGEIYRGCVSF